MKFATFSRKLLNQNWSYLYSFGGSQTPMDPDFKRVCFVLFIIVKQWLSILLLDMTLQTQRFIRFFSKSSSQKREVRSKIIKVTIWSFWFNFFPFLWISHQCYIIRKKHLELDIKNFKDFKFILTSIQVVFVLKVFDFQ